MSVNELFLRCNSLFKFIFQGFSFWNIPSQESSSLWYHSMSMLNTTSEESLNLTVFKPSLQGASDPFVSSCD